LVSFFEFYNPKISSTVPRTSRGATEQSAPEYPSTHTHSPISQSPCPLQSLGQSPSSTTPLPAVVTDLLPPANTTPLVSSPPLTSSTSGSVGVGLSIAASDAAAPCSTEQSAPLKPARHTHVPLTRQTPLLLHASGHTLSAQAPVVPLAQPSSQVHCPPSHTPLPPHMTPSTVGHRGMEQSVPE